MIFVTVGTHTQGFERLIKAVDDLIEKKLIKDDIFIQVGNSSYIPKNCKWVKFLSPDEFENFCKKSKIIITHGGVGSIMTSLKYNKPLIVVPRLKRFDEHTDDHQVQIVRELEKQKKIIAVYDTKALGKAINKARKWKPSGIVKKGKIFYLIESFIRNLEK